MRFKIYCCLLAICMFMLPTHQTCMALESNSWMSHVNDKVLLRDINIPGTHESGTARTTILTSTVASCQSTSIYSQLENGIRYFDLRLNSDLLLNHSGVSCYKSTFKRLYMCHVFDDFNKFLSRNPSETILVQLKEEGGGKNFEAKVNDMLRTQPNIYDNRKNPDAITLGDVRGKIVIFTRSDDLERAYTYTGWPDNCDCSTLHLGRSSVVLQDFYKDTSANAKMSHIENFYNHIWADPATYQSMFYINFTSCTGKLNPKAIAKDVNRKFQEFLNYNRDKKFGIVLMDNPSDSLIMDIYGLNFIG